jgi:flagellar biosynthesis protein FlhG
MIRKYSLEQAAERLGLDHAEFKFLAHHFWEFLPQSHPKYGARQFSEADLALFENIVKMRKIEQLDVTTIRQKLRQDAASQQMYKGRQTELLAFCSGRPGAGISTLVFNLAAALAQRGCRCTIVDGSYDQSGLEALMPDDGGKENWCRVLDSGVRLVSTAKVLAALENANEETAEEVWQELQLLDAASDFVLIDTGPGCSDNALRFAMLVDESIMVTTGDVGMNADCFSVVRMLRDIDPALPLSLIINRAASLGEAREAFARINGAGRKLGVSDVPGLGWVIEDDAIRSCIANGEAVVDTLPQSPSAKCMTLLAEMLTNRLKPAQGQNPGGLPELMRSLGANLYRAVNLRSLLRPPPSNTSINAELAGDIHVTERPNGSFAV